MTKILIANRGEIASRIARTCRILGYTSVGIAAACDKSALHLADCDEIELIDASSPSEPFLSAETLVKVAKKRKCKLLHPGYGFLSESPVLAKACAKAKITFVGPSAECLALFGDKESAKDHASDRGIPILKTTRVSAKEASTGKLPAALQQDLSYPALLKAIAGGGGRGMRLIQSSDELASACESASREAEKFFGNGALLIEPYLENIKHIEVQIACDTNGEIRHFFERECSAQRNYQKVIEEAPSSSISQESRNAIFQFARSLFEDAKYIGLATVEFLVTSDEQVYFTEVNPRLQVEHTVTEEICGTDLVGIQLRLAEGKSLAEISKDFPMPDTPQGHSIQLRLYAESSFDGAPRTGVVSQFNDAALLAADPALRIEAAVRSGSAVTHHFDPMIAKLIVTRRSRNQAIEAAQSTLTHLLLSGIETNVPLLLQVLRSTPFCDGSYTTGLIGSIQAAYPPRAQLHFLSALAGALFQYAPDKGESSSPWSQQDSFRLSPTSMIERQITIEGSAYDISFAFSPNSNDVSFSLSNETQQLAGQLHDVQRIGSQLTFRLDGDHLTFSIQNDGNTSWIQTPYAITEASFGWPKLRKEESAATSRDHAILSPLPGTVIQVSTSEGDAVEEGAVLLVLESMKMEHPITAPATGSIAQLCVQQGEGVTAGQTLATLHHQR